MKKNYKALALLIAVLLSSTTVGCSATVKENEKKDGYQIEIKNEEDIQTNDIEINIEKNDKESTKENNVETKQQDKTENKSNKTSEKTQVKKESKEEVFDKIDTREMYKPSEKVYVTYERHLYDQGDTYSVLTGYGTGGEKIWEYKTEIVPDWQFPTYTFLYGYLDNVFLKDGNTVKVFNIKTGKVEHIIKGFEKYNMEYLTDYKGQLYFATSTGLPRIQQIVTVNDKTFEIESVYEVPESFTDYEFNVFKDKNDIQYLDFYDENDKIIKVGLDSDKLIEAGCKKIK